MIRKTFVYFIGLLTVWVLLTSYKQWPSKSLTQWDDNDRLISRFLFSVDHSKINTIIVGSSMAFRMNLGQNPFNESVYNLSLGGQGLFEGVEILKQSGHLPKKLYIETNVLYRLPRKDYASSFFTPGVYDLKEKFIGFRQEFRPISLSQYIYNGINGKFSKQEIEEPSKNKLDLPNNFDTKQPDSAAQRLININLKRQVALEQEILRDTNWSTIITDLQAYTNFYKKQGVEIIFFEMPTSKNLLESDLNKHIQNLISRKFPEESFKKASPHPTTDGVHLSPKDAGEYLLLLLKDLSQ